MYDNEINARSQEIYQDELDMLIKVKTLGRKPKQTRQSMIGKEKRVYIVLSNQCIKFGW